MQARIKKFFSPDRAREQLVAAHPRFNSASPAAIEDDVNQFLKPHVLRKTAEGGPDVAFSISEIEKLIEQLKALEEARRNGLAPNFADDPRLGAVAKASQRPHEIFRRR